MKNVIAITTLFSLVFVTAVAQTTESPLKTNEQTNHQAKVEQRQEKEREIKKTRNEKKENRKALKAHQKDMNEMSKAAKIKLKRPGKEK